MHRRSGLRCAHHFGPSRREARPLTRRHAVLQRRHCQQAASNDARRLTAGLVMARPHARRHGLSIVMIVVGVGRQHAICSGGDNYGGG